MAHQFYFNPYILDNLPAPAAGFDVVQDMSEPRLRMYVTSRGVKTFFVRKRVGGRDKRIIIGNYPDMDIEDARAAVPTILADAMKKPPRRRNKISFRKLVDLYMANRVRRGEDSRTKLMRAIDRHLPALYQKNVADISSDDIAAVVENISGAAIAGRMHELLLSIFNYAIAQGYVAANPAAAVARVPQHRRMRPLNKSGLQRLIHVLNSGSESADLRAAFLMLIYGFAPKSEIFSMQWRDLDFNHYMWRERPLSDHAVVLLQDLPQDGHWVFPGRGGGHLTDPRTAWRRVATAAGVPNLTMDDVHKFIMRRLTWASDREDFRENMNAVLDEILA